jgi:hypothetical protein
VTLEETYKGTPAIKSAKLYILKDKLTSFKINEDESIPEMFYRLQVIVNDLKSLYEKVGAFTYLPLLRMTSYTVSLTWYF